jgi:hypothetical protein
MRVLDRDISKRKTLGTALFEVGDILNTHSRTRAKRLRKGGWYVMNPSFCFTLLSAFVTTKFLPRVNT